MSIQDNNIITTIDFDESLPYSEFSGKCYGDDFWIEQSKLYETLFQEGLIDVEEYNKQIAFINDECYSYKD